MTSHVKSIAVGDELPSTARPGTAGMHGYLQVLTEKMANPEN